MAKVVLPKEVATAIERMRASGTKNIGIIYGLFAMDARGDRRTLQVFCSQNEDGSNYDRLLEALVNGYEVE